ncbi:MAG: ParA family protein [Ruminococcaceae bacterium]|nr:ParA family protein [Oscillospiraceae bacterium]
MINQKIGNLNIICGHYGSGKTNVAVNLALTARKLYPEKKVHIADIDIVNPYFRTADAKEILEKNGVEVLIPEFANTNVDIPSLPPKLISLFESKDDISIIDVGGDDGSVALGMYRMYINRAGYDMYYVINMYRPLIADPTDCFLCMKEIEDVSGLKCTKIINNSSLGAETTADDIAASVEYAKKCAELCSLPLTAHTYCPDFAPDTPARFAESGYANEILIPIVNATKKLF